MSPSNTNDTKITMCARDCSGIYQWVSPKIDTITGYDTTSLPTVTTGQNIVYKPMTVPVIDLNATTTTAIDWNTITAPDWNIEIQSVPYNIPYTYEFRLNQRPVNVDFFNHILAEKADKADADMDMYEYESKEEGLIASEELLAALDEYSKGDNSDATEKEG